MLTKNIAKIYQLVNNDITILGAIRDHERDLLPDEQKHYKLLYEIYECCLKSPFLVEEFKSGQTPDFDLFVTPEWIKATLKDMEITNRELAIGVNVTESQVSDWLRGVRNPSGAAKAAIYYFFQNKIYNKI